MLFWWASVLMDLYAFLQEHRRCGEPTTDVEEITQGDWRVWMRCSCGAALDRSVDE